MTSQLDLMREKCILARRILVPKHKGNAALASKKQMKSLLEKEEKTEKMWDYMQSMGEIERIMRHFDA